MLLNPIFPGLCPQNAGGAYSALPDPLAGGEGLAALHKNPAPALGLSSVTSKGLRV